VWYFFVFFLDLGQFRQCGIFMFFLDLGQFRQCGIFMFFLDLGQFRQCGIFMFFILLLFQKTFTNKNVTLYTGIGRNNFKSYLYIPDYMLSVHT
jgi:hypothetical protein